MIQTIINTSIGFIITGILSYCIGVVKNSKKMFKNILGEFEQLKDSQLYDMKADLSNKFYIYNSMDEVEDYLVMAFREKCERYFDLNGDSWIHPMYEQSFKWKIKQTGYLK